MKNIFIALLFLTFISCQSVLDKNPDKKEELISLQNSINTKIEKELETLGIGNVFSKKEWDEITKNYKAISDAAEKEIAKANSISSEEELNQILNNLYEKQADIRIITRSYKAKQQKRLLKKNRKK